MMSQGHSVLVLAVDPWVRLVGLDVEKMAQQVENNKSLAGAGGTFYVPPVIYLGTKMKLYYRRPYVRVKHKQINMNIIY